ncbi:hypothetical protein JOB18_025564 [Solea senegalensis]|uniref:protein-glutamine gamma-glutamyltransferase n=1 Tax=Solea senegalensis TaxID=28829 RepID=A0AAV6T7G9_SOLSE|nr:coagulation factor XIII A chain-like [Solea senegalensis]XP_043893699.1 coagulation factor XIII A chain-like [Solea senegalensis]KAG7525320.1 coagulation factor XIII A chain [Solea senegalensis]KAG7525321.1 hypothetical protein JOB18_025564 [Solea senegalensis]
MSQTRVSKKSKGRFAAEVPTTNLGDDDDIPEFEPYEDAAVKPRSHPQGALTVQEVDMCQQVNKPKHYTDSYHIDQLVTRRGQEFVMRVTFNRPLTPDDDFHIEFRIGSSPSSNKGSLITVVFGPNSCSTHSSSGSCGSWSGQIVETVGNTVTLGITPRPDAIVGRFRTYVAVSGAYTNRDTGTDLYLLFNAWCPEDSVFVPNASERNEYVLNDIGVLYQGTAGSIAHRNWMFGQFERGILDACIYILDTSLMPISDRGNIIKVIRKASAMINAQDDQGVLVGNWSDDFGHETPPTSWTGSTSILQKYVNSGVPICFAQCWVFAGVLNTFLRCLGIPARVITNFSSAHDNTGNLKIDLIFKMDGTPDRRHTRDSIWNYHCWNEVFMYRRDLPDKFSGWQVVDATPQETSDGYYRCGPASVAAIKDGEVSYPFDCGFVFAEVNSNVVCYKRDRYGNLSPFSVDKTLVGQAIYTKSIGSTAPMDITYSYKNPQDSPEDQKAMALAESFGLAMDHSEVPDVPLIVTIHGDQCVMCEDVNLTVELQNNGDVPKTVVAQLSVAVINYTGYPGPDFKTDIIEVTVPAQQTQRVDVKTAAVDYMPHLINQPFLYFTLSGQADGQILTARKVVTILTPPLNLTLHSQPQLNQQSFVTVSFTNMLSCTLHNVSLTIDGPQVMSVKTHTFEPIAPQASISWTEILQPRMHGPRCIVAVLNSSNVTQMWGYNEFTVLP